MIRKVINVSDGGELGDRKQHEVGIPYSSNKSIVFDNRPYLRYVCRMHLYGISVVGHGFH